MAEQTKQTLPPQTQERRPGLETEMNPQPQDERTHQKGCGRLEGKAAIITGGDSGIGRAVAAPRAWRWIPATPMIARWKSRRAPC